MKKNTKKKVFTLMLVIMLLSIAIVGGSLAWFTAEDETTNTFTVGSIKVVQHEKDNDGNLFDQNQPLMPIVNVVNPAEDPNYIEKVVTVENTGKNSAYLRTHIAMPSKLTGYLIPDIAVSSGWTYEGFYPITVDGVDYSVSYYMHDAALEPKDTTDALLKGVYLSPKVDVQVDPENSELGPQFCLREPHDGSLLFSGFPVKDATEINVLVLTQAVQADGFDDCATALNNAFGTPNRDKNPFIAE